MKLSRDQKLLFGFPVLFAVAMAGLAIPISVAVLRNNPLWLLLWVPCGAVVGVLLAYVDTVANE